ncbi:HDOD domain-containing protein [bacterium]|nr:HDOD domain-containing protein [bacterium]MBU1994062.1 HDOD domain-containing protein [bacterium]
MKSSIIDSIKSLPPLSKTILDINMIYANENSSIHDLAKIIEHDPMIVANLLKAANSPLYSFGREIRSVAHAVSLFGMSMTRSIALGNSIRKLLNVDMQPYGITPERFAEVSHIQAMLMLNWYKQINKEKSDKLYLAAFLQETGKIVISSEIIQEDESISFYSEIETSNDLAMVEKSYVDVTTADVTAAVFSHWGFDKEFIEMIKYADNPSAAPEEVQEYSMALHIVKTIVPINKPFSEVAINIGLRQAAEAGYNHQLLENSIHNILENLKR